MYIKHASQRASTDSRKLITTKIEDIIITLFRSNVSKMSSLRMTMMSCY